MILSWTNTIRSFNEAEATDAAIDKFRLLACGFRECGLKHDEAVEVAAANVGLSNRRGRTLYRRDGIVRSNLAELHAISRGLARVARTIAQWHRRRAEYWDRLAAAEDAEQIGQLSFGDAAKWNTTKPQTAKRDAIPTLRGAAA